MNLNKLLLIALLGLLTISSCKKDDENTDDDDPVMLPDNVAEITENIYSYVGDDEYYSMFVVTTDGVIAIESVSTSHSEGLLEAIREVTDQPVKYMLHSHDHWDSASGGQVFKDAGATTVAHTEAVKSMTANTGPDMVVPDESWEGCQSNIVLGETTVEMHYFGINHGQGMTVFIVAGTKVAYIADLVTPNRVLFTIVPDFNIPEWERSLEEIILMDFDKAVYGRNDSPDALNGGTKEDVETNLQLIRDIRGGFFAELQAGTPFGAIPTTLELPQYEDFTGYEDWLPMNVWRIALDALMGPYPIATVNPCVMHADPAAPSQASGITQGEAAEIADGVYSYAEGGGPFSMFVVTDEGVLVFESYNSSHSRGLLEAIAGVTSQPVRYLFHSHDHWDHSSGGQVFKDAGATVIAHKEAYDVMETNPGPDMVVPDEFWEGCESSITLGGTTVEMHFLGINHGLGMTVFLVPDKQVAFVADLVTPNRVLFAMVPDFNIPEWERSIERIIDMDFTKAVYSHNEDPNANSVGGDKQDAIDNLQLIRDIRTAIAAEAQSGTPTADIPAAVKLPQYQNLVGYDAWFTMNVWRIYLDDQMGPYPWRPDVPCGD